MTELEGIFTGIWTTTNVMPSGKECHQDRGECVHGTARKQ